MAVGHARRSSASEAGSRRTSPIFGIAPARADRFVTRLFGARELALAGSLLGAPAGALAPVAALGVAIDAVAGFDERRRGTLSLRATPPAMKQTMCLPLGCS